MLSGIDVNEYMGPDEEFVCDNTKSLSKSTTQESLLAMEDDSGDRKKLRLDFSNTNDTLLRLQQKLVKLFKSVSRQMNKKDNPPHILLLKELLYLIGVTLNLFQCQ